MNIVWAQRYLLFSKYEVKSGGSKTSGHSIVNPIVDQAVGEVDRDLEVETDDRDLGDRDPEEESGENFKESVQRKTRRLSQEKFSSACNIRYFVSF